MSVMTRHPFAELEPIELDELNQQAALQTRVDRKYILDGERLARLTTALTTHVECRVLTIAGQQRFAYRSTYFDTPGFDCYLAAARSRPTRYKVRLRTYLDTADSFVEVKTRKRGGDTVKTRIGVEGDETSRLSPATLAFVDAALTTGLTSRAADAARSHTADLAAVLVTDYLRTTLCVADDPRRGDRSSRVTIDTELSFAAPGHVDRSRHPSQPRSGAKSVAVVETKTTGGAGPVDRCLWALGIRPATISKYGVGMALIHPELARNKWHRTIGRHLPSHQTDHIQQGRLDA